MPILIVSRNLSNKTQWRMNHNPTSRCQWYQDQITNTTQRGPALGMCVSTNICKFWLSGIDDMHLKILSVRCQPFLPWQRIIYTYIYVYIYSILWCCVINCDYNRKLYSYEHNIVVQQLGIVRLLGIPICRTQSRDWWADCKPSEYCPVVIENICHNIFSS